MDERRSSTGRLKRQVKSFNDDSWDCSVCTYRNTAEAYKCEMCDVRKGTSTRKPRPNPQLVAAQAAQQFSILPHSRRDEQCSSRPLPSNKSKTSNKRRPRLKNIDRSSAKQMEVTVGSVTVVITDYEPKKGTSRQTSSETVSTVNTDSSDNNSSLLANDTTQDMATDDEDRS